jgi:hypothetical protein
MYSSLGRLPRGACGLELRWPRHPLPNHLADLVSRANGIHLWADLETGRAYEGLAPLDEWGLARVKMGGRDDSPASLRDQYLALSYHADSAAFESCCIGQRGRTA